QARNGATVTSRPGARGLITFLFFFSCSLFLFSFPVLFSCSLFLFSFPATAPAIARSVPVADVVYMISDMLFSSKLREAAKATGVSVQAARDPAAWAEAARGAAVVAGAAVAWRRPPGGSGLLRAGAFGRLLGLALLGAVCAPALLVAGVKRTDAVTTSLLLTLEAPFTMLLAWLLFREHLGRRALVAAALVLGGALLAAAPPGAL